MKTHGNLLVENQPGENTELWSKVSYRKAPKVAKRRTGESENVDSPSLLSYAQAAAHPTKPNFKVGCAENEEILPARAEIKKKKV